jgi:hypothetical protein
MIAAPTLLGPALRYSRLGLPIFPLRACEKAPPLTPRGFYDASANEAQIRNWWTRWPFANIGLPTGATSKMVVLDIDPRNGGPADRSEIVRQFGPLPETCEVITGGGGRHIYFLYEGGPVPKQLAPGVDLKGDGGYVVAPPSIHPSGARYRIDGLEGPRAFLNIAPAPDWLLQRLAASSHNNGRRTETIDGKWLVGERNNKLASVAGTMRRAGFSREAIEAALLEENRRRCDPPLPEDEVRAIAQSIARYAPVEEAGEPLSEEALAAFPTAEEEAARPEGRAGEARGLVSSVEDYIRRYAVLPQRAYLPTALWSIATYMPKAFGCFPYLALFSPAKRCGKTRLLEVLETLVSRPWRGTAPTAPALYRMLSDSPTLLLDEVEGLNRGNASETVQAVNAVLNAGHRKGATVPRCVGKKYELEYFPTYGPKAFAVIGRLSDTLADRSIIVTMQRRTEGQRIERFLAARANAEVKPVRDALADFAKGHSGEVEQAYSRLLDADLKSLGDRDADLWLPIFAVCTVAAPERVTELERCAVALCDAKAEGDVDDSLPLRLLADIREVWPTGEKQWDTASLIGELRAIEESPWSESECELSPRKLARMLRPFGVQARKIRLEERTARGYLYEELASAFIRY